MPERIGALVPGVLRRVEQAHGALFAVQREWRRLVGGPLAAHTRPVSLRRGRLTVQADRPGDSFTLHYLRATLLPRVREVTGGRVEELVVRPGEPAKPKR